MRLCLFRISARVRLNVRRGSLPAYFNLDEAVCIAGCNEDLNYTLGIRCAVLLCCQRIFSAVSFDHLQLLYFEHSTVSERSEPCK